MASRNTGGVERIQPDRGPATPRWLQEAILCGSARWTRPIPTRHDSAAPP